MKKELLAVAGKLLHGEEWVTALSVDLNINRKTIQRYNSGEKQIRQDIVPELIMLLNVKKASLDPQKESIENAIDALEKDFYIDEKIDLAKTFVVVSEGGHLLDEQFKTIEDAQKWVEETWDEDDRYLAAYHQMTVAEQYALETMQHFSDVYEPKEVLKAIKSGQFEKSEQEYYLDLCNLDENHLGREYYAYYLANEFNLSNTPSFNCSDEPDFDLKKTISYKQFVMKRIADLSKFAASL